MAEDEVVDEVTQPIRLGKYGRRVELTTMEETWARIRSRKWPAIEGLSRAEANRKEPEGSPKINVEINAEPAVASLAAPDQRARKSRFWRAVSKAGGFGALGWRALRRWARAIPRRPSL